MNSKMSPIIAIIFQKISTHSMLKSKSDSFEEDNIVLSFHFPIISQKNFYIFAILRLRWRRWQYRLLFFQRFLSIVERKILYRTTIANTALNTNRKTRDLWFWILDISSFVDNEAGIISRKIGASWRKREVWGKGKDDFSLADENRWRHRWPWC